MNIKNLKIATQLRIGLGAIFLLVALLGGVAWFQAGILWEHTRDLYNHPLTVRRALSDIRFDILTIHIAMKDLALTNNEQDRQTYIQKIDDHEAKALEQFKVLRERYLGPRADIDKAHSDLVQWKSIRDETIRLLRDGKRDLAAERTKITGPGGAHVKTVMSDIDEIISFSATEADQFYINAQQEKESLMVRLAAILCSIFTLAIVVGYFLLKSVRTPLQELTLAATQFSNGNMAARSTYQSANEFGVLSDAFNALAHTVEMEMHSKDNSAAIVDVMLQVEELRAFCHELLKGLLDHTGSQVGAVYLLNEQKTAFEYFESIGMTTAGHASFSAIDLEGEFGMALATKQIQLISNIPVDSRCSFATVSGEFLPREIITIPILLEQEVVAVVSLSGVNSYTAEAVRLVNDVWQVITARLNSMLVMQKLRDFSDKLERQNRELEAQKVEMSSQSAELITQNTELEMQKKLLDEASRLKTNFLSNMSHELRTPLNSVIALSGVLNRRLATLIPEEEYSYLEVIERNGKLLLALINDILDIARIESGREEIEITKFNVNSLVAEVTSMIHPQAQQKNIELLHTDSGTNLTLTSDAVKCRHILQNLIANAVKFTEEGAVEISARQNGTSIEISVIDTGIGIDTAHLPHIFDEFRQADGSTSRKFGGTGLGLAIAKKYAGLIGGTISVKSTPGKGSEFTLILPVRYNVENRTFVKETTSDFKYALTQAPKYQPSPHPHPNPPPEGEGTLPTFLPFQGGGQEGDGVKTILLVEDSEPAIVQLRDILEEDGYQILVARDGGEALGIIARTVPDAMVLDLMMPGIDGFEVLKMLRGAERTAHIPVLILTAKHITKEELKDLKRNNVHQLIQKGDVNRAELQNAVATMVLPETVETVQTQRELQVIEGKPVVLVVEDNPDNMITVKALLAGNYTLIEAVDGDKGIEMAMKHRPHLILMDIALPGMDGIEVFKTIRKEALLQHIPVIALTASAMISDRETILAHGFDAYIAKPIDETILFKLVSETLYGS
jgi:signal transduction histidine kinase/DNA-binding response OmpR family regulator/HAMP domain-containing protein